MFEAGKKLYSSTVETVSRWIDLIQDELNVESQNIEKCRKFLEPDEAARFNEKHSISPQSQLATGHTVLHKLTVSEQILFKYKRSNELR